MEIPRDRNGEFKKQQTLPAYKRTNDTLEKPLLSIYSKKVLRCLKLLI
nr:transposase [Enterococcus faecium]